MKSKVIIGIDPGFSGGVAILTDDGIETVNMPEEFPLSKMIHNAHLFHGHRILRKNKNFLLIKN